MSVLTKNLTDCNKIMYGLNFNVLLYLLITADASKPQRPKKDSESSTREELEEEKKRLREVSQQLMYMYNKGTDKESQFRIKLEVNNHIKLFKYTFNIGSWFYHNFFLEIEILKMMERIFLWQNAHLLTPGIWLKTGRYEGRIWKRKKWQEKNSAGYAEAKSLLRHQIILRGWPDSCTTPYSRR